MAPPALSSNVLLTKQVVALAADPKSNTPLIALAPFGLSDRLAALNWADVAQVASSGKRVEVFRSIGGQLDYRIRPVRRLLPRRRPAVERRPARAAQRIAPGGWRSLGVASAAARQAVGAGDPWDSAASQAIRRRRTIGVTASGSVTWGATMWAFDLVDCSQTNWDEQGHWGGRVRGLRSCELGSG